MKQSLLIIALLFTATCSFAQDTNIPALQESNVSESQEISGLRSAKLDPSIEAPRKAASNSSSMIYDIHGNLNGYYVPNKYEFGSIICDPYGGYAHTYGH
jgi:hypothetical protein